MDRLVRQRQHIEQRGQMAHGGVDVDRLDGIAAPDMHGVERLSEPDEILEVAVVAGPPAALAIEGVGRRGDRAEGDMRAADLDVALGIARVQRETFRREPDLGFDQRRIESHPIRARIDVGAGVLQQRLGLGVQHVHADLAEHLQRGLVDRFEFVARDQLDRRKQQPRLRLALGGFAAAFGRAPAAARLILARGFVRHALWSRSRFSADDSLSALAAPCAKMASAYAAPCSRGRRPRPRRDRLYPDRDRRPATAVNDRGYGRSPYFAATLAGWPAASSSRGRSAAKRAMSQERNSATASLLKSSGCVVR